MHPDLAGPSPPKYGSGTSLPGLAEEGADPGVLVSVADPDLLAVLLQQEVGRSLQRIVGHAEHLLGGVVVGIERRLPVAQRIPLRIAEERRPGAVEGVGVAEAAAADAGSGDDEDVLEDGHPEDPAEPDLRHPVVAAEVPGRLREVLVAISTTAFQDGDAVALLAPGEGQRRIRRNRSRSRSSRSRGAPPLRSPPQPSPGDSALTPTQRAARLKWLCKGHSGFHDGDGSPLTPGRADGESLACACLGGVPRHGG